jgi:hypothetical protein
MTVPGRVRPAAKLTFRLRLRKNVARVSDPWAWNHGSETRATHACGILL